MWKSERGQSFRAVLYALVGLAWAAPCAQAGPLGPVAYLSFSDSPFSGLTFDYFHLETFEDHALNTPGVAGDGAVTGSLGFRGTIIDSVFGDGNCPQASAPTPCDSYFKTAPVTFAFNAGALGGSLPTHVGLVCTDGGDPVTLTVVGPGGPLGSVSGDGFADGNFSGGTAEDRFFGWTDPAGILSITMSGNAPGIEVDHLQYGLIDSAQVIPEPASLVLLTTGGLGLLAKARRRKTQQTRS
jgi:hypothetical protein